MDTMEVQSDGGGMPGSGLPFLVAVKFEGRLESSKREQSKTGISGGKTQSHVTHRWSATVKCRLWTEV